jgi:GST-like protein
MSVRAALMWPVGGFDPIPHQLSHFLTVKDEADRRYSIERY